MLRVFICSGDLLNWNLRGAKPSFRKFEDANKVGFSERSGAFDQVMLQLAYSLTRRNSVPTLLAPHPSTTG